MSVRPVHVRVCVFLGPLGFFACESTFQHTKEFCIGCQQGRLFVFEETYLCLVQNPPCCMFCFIFIRSTLAGIVVQKHFHAVNVSLCHRNVRKTIKEKHSIKRSTHFNDCRSFSSKVRHLVAKSRATGETWFFFI